MKSQSLKLFAIAFVLGLVTIFASASPVAAQSNLSFKAPFDFHVGKDTLSAGQYQFREMSYGQYVLTNVEKHEARIVFFDITESNNPSAAAQRVSFNRYGDTYFLRSIFLEPDADGKQMIESNYEKQIRKGTVTIQSRLDGEKAKPEIVSINLSK